MPPTSGFTLRYEDEADGVVASVFRDVRARMEFVPAIFKALAPDPEALVPAWLQARAIYDDPRTGEALARLRKRAESDLSYRPSNGGVDAVAPFAQELPALLLIVTSLGLALDGVLPLQPLPPPGLPPPGPVPDSPVPDERGEHALFGEIRAAYLTQHVPSMYRALAARGLLDEPWSAIGPFLAGEAGTECVAGVCAVAELQALRFSEVAFFGAERAGSPRPVPARAAP
ncbi:MAG: hypothetical protein EXQ81_03930 [Thermoleophilia bacterium]|nr:hypothetical protein [Thermoleophilia bacterium]